MSEITVVDRRGNYDEVEEECSGGCEGCGGCLPQPTNDDSALTPGTFVVSKLTGQKLMLIKAEPENPPSYIVRTRDYQLVRLFDFELEVPPRDKWHDIGHVQLRPGRRKKP